MYYENFEKLCISRGIRPGTVSKGTGISTATLTSWKQGKYTPKQDKLQKIADYFGVTVGYLLGKQETEKAPTEAGERSVSDDDIKFALFGGDGEITDAMYEEVRRFAAFVKQREAEKKE